MRKERNKIKGKSNVTVGGELKGCWRGIKNSFSKKKSLLMTDTMA